MAKPLDGAGTSFNNVQQRKKRFLNAYAECANISEAAQAATIERTVVYAWQEHDEQFAAEMRQSKEIAADLVEREIHRRAVEGWEEPVYQGGKLVGKILRKSDTLLIFWAKALRPEKFRERYDVTTGGEPLVKAYGLSPEQLDKV